MKTGRPATAAAYPTHDVVAPRKPAHIAHPRGGVRIDVHHNVARAQELARDVLRGLSASQKFLPPKYFYDDRGSQLFDAICDLPEYYLTRTEQELLEGVVDEIVSIAQPSDMIEFGSGAARKTRILLDALDRAGRALRYIPMDVNESMLRRAAHALRFDYPRVRIHAVVGDYERHLHRLPRGRQRLVVFLGSTLGNFTPRATAAFLANVRRRLASGDHLLLGVDLVKPVDVIEAAYNDSAGVTAAFNRNVLHVINRDLDANFDPDAFEHVAFFNQNQSQIEMHLRAHAPHRVAVCRLNVTVPFAAGETIHTEISRKFTPAEIESTLAAAGYRLTRWYTPANAYFGLALARPI